MEMFILSCLCLSGIVIVNAQSSCSYGLHECEFYPWEAWSACNSTCGGTRYRMKPLCCVHVQGQQTTFDECLQSCNITRQQYFQNKYEEQSCEGCTNVQTKPQATTVTTQTVPSCVDDSRVACDQSACDSGLKMFCQATCNLCSIPHVPSTSRCPKGWAEFQGECLLFSPEKKNWFEAHSSCRSHQAYLATDDSAEKHSFMRKIISILDGEGFRNFFIGATDLVFEGQWLWTETGTAQKGYTAWEPGKPDNNVSLSIKKNCLMCFLDGDNLYWTDNDCYDRNVHFICEKQNIKASCGIGRPERDSM
ncbi:neurocan core protein-like [Mytilus trossulus]|uniref:neurocan core protein-like n=1 Tax=Mytilus trossulus TaxID=6551 RepID=UPI0030042BFF